MQNKKCRPKRDDTAECTISLAATQHKCVYSTKYYVMRNKYNSTERIILRQINTTIQLRRKYILPNIHIFCQSVLYAQSKINLYKNKFGLRLGIYQYK